MYDITVAFAVKTTSLGDAPEAAGKVLREPMKDKPFPSLPGLGDEAYRWNDGVIMRVSNLVVAIVVFPNHEPTQENIRAFAADVAGRLQAR